MAWHRIGDKPLSEPMLTRFVDAYMRHQGEMGWSWYQSHHFACWLYPVLYKICLLVSYRTYHSHNGSRKLVNSWCYFNETTHIVVNENAFENATCKMATILVKRENASVSLHISLYQTVSGINRTLSLTLTPSCYRAHFLGANWTGKFTRTPNVLACLAQ